MKVLLTGASSGIGKDMAFVLNDLGYDLVLVARDKKKLNNLKKELEDKKHNNIIETFSLDLSKEENCIDLCNKYDDIDILINNAGFGECGKFDETSLLKELDMIKTNIIALHILTKEFLKKMKKRDCGKILNVASIAGFLPGPLMATYYASKAYVVRISEAIREELKKDKSNVKISILCPGPVKTNFSKNANVNFKLKEADSYKIAKYAIKNLHKSRFYIVPTFKIKLIKLLSRLVPNSVTSSIAYKIQKRKITY